MIYWKTLVDLSLGMVGMLILLRATGKKTLSDLTPFDLVFIMVIGGILEQVIYEPYRPITYALWGFLVWGLLIFFIEKLTVKGDHFRHLLKGRPALLINDGKLNRFELERNNIELEQLRTLIRKNDCFSMKRVKQLILEVDGQATLLTHRDVDDSLTYFLIDEGIIEDKVLETLKKDEKLLFQSLNELGFTNVKDIYYGEWSPEFGFYIQTYDETKGHFICVDG
ncbi:DUF421 domain-containing protein [Alkalibacterium sp. MB6]|uniref:DUF421 domain-containing protein n=1 Tax=Alkalibacterium sp. MB6 TaxID=2081965 RepID=UPI00137B0C61|nr:YetF domain-containing protein [Alkalibacterium sp. MB6]